MELNKELTIRASKKKPVRFLTKKGVNLAANNEARNKGIKLIVGVAAIALVAGAIAKFGVIDLYTKQNAAEADYMAAKEQNDAVAEKLQNYEAVQLEYRTYSMDWMENDTSGKYVSVDRREILNMIEKKMMTRGTVTSVEINGETVVVEMQDMDLNQISKMCGVLEAMEIVESATLERAEKSFGSGTTGADTAEGEEAEETDTAASVDNLTFTITIELKAKTAAPAAAEAETAEEE